MVSSNANALGVIFANSYDNLVPELVAERTMASIPFAGRYRMIDFVLSNMANAGVDNVSVIVRKNYHSLMDHLGAGREWDLTRKRGGLNIVPPFAERSIKLYSGRVDALASDALQRYGLPAACCSDGPSGIRMDCGTVAFAMPNGTCLAATFNEGLSEELYSMEGLELRKNHVDTLLGPGINIHRHPLNGRNFEYFSEDPLLTGKMACAQLRGMHRWGVTGTIKHFATNNQEHRRHFVESVVSERALREIYLRGFEIAVKEGHARSIMTSYNPLNGYWTASNYDLVTTILRGQWCYTGIVMSDWWADGNDRDGAGSTKHVAAMVRAQNDVFMVVTDPEHNSGSDDLAVALTEGRLFRGELQRSAANICRFLLQTPAFRRSIGRTTALDAQLEAMAEQDMQQAAQNGQPLTLHGGVSIDPAAIDNGYRRTTAFCVMVEQGGAYTLHLRCRAMPGNSPLAQIPVSIFAGRVFVKTITITGAQTDWCEFTAALPAVDAGKTFYLRFYFGQSGMELDAVSLDLLS